VVIAFADQGPKQSGGGDGGISTLRGGPTPVVLQQQLDGLVGMAGGEVSGSSHMGDSRYLGAPCRYRTSEDQGIYF
jgi:phage tail tape-measure protein